MPLVAIRLCRNRLKPSLPLAARSSWAPWSACAVGPPRFSGTVIPSAAEAGRIDALMGRHPSGYVAPHVCRGKPCSSDAHCRL